MTRKCLVRNSRMVLTSQVLHRTIRAGVKRLSDNSFSLDTEFYGSDAPLKHPPKLLFIAGLLSVLLGTLIGVYGFTRLKTADASEQTLLGAAGYFLTIVIPIAVLQIIRSKHDSALRVNQDEPYDIYAGQRMQSQFLKIVALGFVVASLSIIVFFWPVAQGFAS
jgi:hypothetical protein